MFISVCKYLTIKIILSFYIFWDIFINNTVADDNGGAIFATDNVKCVDSIFTGNSAYFRGGAIYNYGNVLNESIIECLLRNKMKTVKPDKFERKVNKQIIKYFSYKH